MRFSIQVNQMKIMNLKGEYVMTLRTVFSKEFLTVLLESVHEGYGWDDVSGQEIEEQIHVVA